MGKYVAIALFVFLLTILAVIIIWMRSRSESFLDTISMETAFAVFQGEAGRPPTQPEFMKMVAMTTLDEVRELGREANRDAELSASALPTIAGMGAPLASVEAQFKNFDRIQEVVDVYRDVYSVDPDTQTAQWLTAKYATFEYDPELLRAYIKDLPEYREMLRTRMVLTGTMPELQTPADVLIDEINGAVKGVGITRSNKISAVTASVNKTVPATAPVQSEGLHPPRPKDQGLPQDPNDPNFSMLITPATWKYPADSVPKCRTSRVVGVDPLIDQTSLIGTLLVDASKGGEGSIMPKGYYVQEGTKLGDAMIASENSKK